MTMLNTKFESSSRLLHTFSTLFDNVPRTHQQTSVLSAAWIDTVLGSIIAIADETTLYLLEFETKRGLKKEIERLYSRGFTIISGNTPAIQSITRELAAYFSGTLMEFKTPYRVLGSVFQQDVWQVLCKIPYGETKSYREQAIALGRPTAYRAVANANGANQLSIVIPCHRIIASDGSLGGYSGGLAVKQWLLEHEKRTLQK